MHVASLHVHPVKSCAPVDLTSAEVEPWGLAEDRRWLVVDEAGERVGPLRDDRILHLRALPVEGGLRLEAPGREPLEVARPVDGPWIAVAVSRLPAMRYAGAAASAWLTAYLGQAVRLGWLDDPRRRSVSPSHGGRVGDVLSLADTAPLLLTTTASLVRLGEWVAEWPDPVELSMRRFRPNLVVDGAPDELGPFAEDRWRRITVGDVAFRFTERCDRCAVTTIDPTDLAHGKEPIRSLARHRREDGRTWFGVRILPVGPGRVSVGDPVTVEETADPPEPGRALRPGGRAR